MNRIFIIAGVIAALIGASYLFLRFNRQLESIPFLTPVAKMFGLVEEPVIPLSYNAVFVIFDPSGSARTTYSVPRITVDFIEQVIAGIEQIGHGDIWLSFIDRSALNNEVLHFTIPEKVQPLQAPVRKTGELLGEFNRRLAKFRADSTNHAALKAARLQSHQDAKARFLKKCSVMIAEEYVPKRPSEDFSDITGILNAAVRTLSTVHSDSASFRSILFISDGVQCLPPGDRSQPLNDIPDDILVVTVNHGGSPTSVVAGKSLEVESLQRGLNAVLRKYSKNR